VPTVGHRNFSVCTSGFFQRATAGLSLEAMRFACPVSATCAARWVLGGSPLPALLLAREGRLLSAGAGGTCTTCRIPRTGTECTCLLYLFAVPCCRCGRCSSTASSCGSAVSVGRACLRLWQLPRTPSPSSRCRCHHPPPCFHISCRRGTSTHTVSSMQRGARDRPPPPRHHHTHTEMSCADALQARQPLAEASKWGRTPRMPVCPAPNCAGLLLQNRS
jgi:hypothetical protein